MDDRCCVCRGYFEEWIFERINKGIKVKEIDEWEYETEEKGCYKKVYAHHYCVEDLIDQYVEAIYEEVDGMD